MSEISDLTNKVDALVGAVDDLNVAITDASDLFKSNAADAVELVATKAEIVNDAAKLSAALDAVASAQATLASLTAPPVSNTAPVTSLSR